ncbi:glycosidase [candidate division KSB1 bacterium]|nr:glycoside hydrolase family 130 protein [candidate division KSB1 bacterium]RQW01970.1 MAG: glycosidase [candidate division KSB1 bacterium]
MPKIKILGQPSLSTIPWQDRPAGSSEVCWRYSNNPVIPRDALPNSNSIFNSAVIPFKDQFAGIFRVDNKVREMKLHRGFSKNAIDWQIEAEPLRFQCDDAEIGNFVYGYDPRVVRLDNRYYVQWCNWYHGPTIGLAWSDDFNTFHQLENAFLPFNRNGVLFPRKIHGNYAMLSRPSDSGHTPFGDIYYSESPDLTYWGKHRHVMGPVDNSWQYRKVGGGPTPIETSEGWLLIYHGVLESCNGFVYSAGAALLDIDQPWKVIGRARSYILNPREYYECVGDVQNVVFPCATLCDADTGRLAIYYGAADTVVALAFTFVDNLIDLIKTDAW